MKLIVGLGNPGREYADNRHNIGFMCLDGVAKKNGIKLNERQGKAKTGSGHIGGEEVTLVKPQTFMNLSGDAVAALVRKLKVEPQDILVIHDDLDLPLGRIRIREKGGAGGHNGLKSIIARLGTQEFARVRVGIGRPQEGDRTDVIDYVLEDFARSEQPVIEETCQKVAEAVEVAVSDGVGTAMNRFNG